jgi:hypothetical protein
MNHRRFGELTIAWECRDLSFDVVAAALPLELPTLDEHHAPGSATITVRAWSVPEPIEDPTARGATPLLFHVGTRCSFDPSGFFLWDGASRVRVARGGALIEAEVHERSFERSHAYFASVTMMMALQMALRAHGYFHVHACGATWPDGERWLLPAESDAGKSTLALSVCSSGATFLSDDALVLRRVGVDVEALGWLRPMRMTRATAAAFPGLMALATPCPAGSARDFEVDPRVAFPGRGIAAMPSPFTLLFPRIADQEVSSVRALDRAEAFGRLLHACAWVASEHVPRRDEQLDVLRRLVAQSRADELAAGTGLLRDPVAEVGVLRELLARR